MEITAIGQSLSNETRVRILTIVADNPCPAVEAHRQYEDEFAEGKYRETIYRELENLVEAGLLSKEYNEEEGQIEYKLKHREILLDLANGKVMANNQ